MKKMIARAKRTWMGRMLCRLAGDRAGAVMMEYVILGTMIAAAVVVAVMFFGDNIKGAFNVMGKATTGDSADAVAEQAKNKARSTEAIAESESHRTSIVDK